MSKGFQYYKLDTNRYEDIRIRKLRRAYGTKGIAVYDFLLARIYRVDGCYTACDEECIFSIVDYFDIREDVVNEIICYCGAVGLFDKDLLSRDNVVTSHAIQRRYAEMCKAAKRPYVDIPKDFILVTEQELGMKILLSENSGKNEKTPEKTQKFQEKSQKLQSNNDGSLNDEENENSGKNEENSGKIAENSGKNEKTPETEKRKEPKENKSSKSIIVEPSSKEEDSMSLTPDGVTDASSSSGSSLLFDVPEVEKESDIDYAELVTFWNTVTKGAFGRLKNIENKRRQMTRARIRENGKEAFLQAIRNAAASEFLHTVTWFDYDWMICPNNFVKVFEDKYGKRERTESAGSSGLGPAGLEAANSVRLDGEQGGNVKPVRKRIYD